MDVTFDPAGVHAGLAIGEAPPTATGQISCR
jgi:hypothetical protein